MNPWRVWLFLLAAQTTAAFASPEYIPLQEKAEGQSLVGSALLNDSLYSNPAAGAFSSVYSLDGTYSASQSFEVSLFDTKTTSTGGGISYYRENISDSNEVRQGGRLGVLGRVSDTIGIGLAGKAEWGTGLDGVDDSMKDLDMGVLANFNSLQLGLALRNVFGGDVHYDQFREYAVGGRINYLQTLFLSAAATSKWGDFTPYQYGVGVEYDSPYYFAIKCGYLYQRPYAQGNFQGNWTAGASFIAPRISFHYAVEFPAIASGSAVHTLGTMIMF